jgi:putative transposase
VTVYRHISEARKAKGLSVSLQCELLGVSQSGYWAWARRAPSDRALHDAWLTERIRAIHAASKGRYGSPRVHAMLRREGIRLGEKRVARLMRSAGLQGAHRRRRKGCTVPVEGVEPFRDLVGRDFGPDAPDRVWCADIKQVKTGRAGCTWPRCRTSSAVGSWAGRWRPTCAPSSWSRRWRWPSADAGRPRGRSITPTTAAKYIGLTFGQTCHDAGIAQSMGAVGSCFDNAVAETFFAT